MDSATAKSLPRTLKYLPGVYQEHGSIPGTPLWTILSIIEAFFSDLEEKLERLPEYSDPDIAPLAEHPDHDFLSWLAQWVAMSLDRDLLAECFTAEGLTGEKIQRRWRRLIKDAARLYRLRGTPLGLRYMVEVVYDVDVEIIERAWPQGMVIGVCSSIGEQTFIIDPPDFARSFLVLIEPPVPEQTLSEPSENWLDVPYTDEDIVQKGRLRACVGTKTALTSDASYLENLRKIKQFVDREKPIHTQCFIAFQGGQPSPEEAPGLPRMVIGLESTIEQSIIDEE